MLNEYVLPLDLELRAHMFGPLSEPEWFHQTFPPLPLHPVDLKGGGDTITNSQAHEGMLLVVSYPTKWIALERAGPG